ncbi:MAG: ATP-binding protein [Xanthobacteraceae bacterium]|nr:ATP-binding protein [Xanthobacteraceae bacterium]
MIRHPHGCRLQSRQQCDHLRPRQRYLVAHARSHCGTKRRGPGTAEGDRAQVFKPFFWAEASRNLDHGSVGLGLTIVRQIVESCRGTIHIEDPPDGGALIRVILPRA